MAKKAKKTVKKKTVKKTAVKKKAAKKKTTKKVAKTKKAKTAKKTAVKKKITKKKTAKVKKTKKKRKTKTKAVKSQPPLRNNPYASLVKEKPLTKSPLTKAEILHFTELLLQKRTELIGDVNSMESEALRTSRMDASGDLSSMPIHMADIGTDNFEQEFALGLMDSERKLLKEINDALGRIIAGVYGICEGTGQAIPKPRLEANPWARYTVQYAELVEKGLIEEGETLFEEPDEDEFDDDDTDDGNDDFDDSDNEDEDEDEDEELDKEEFFEEFLESEDD